MDSKLPYYMAYPMPLLYDDERIERRDYDYMKSMYPQTAKQVMPYIEEECDRMQYDGSMMYDEYPDQLQLHLMCRRIYDRMTEDRQEMEEQEEVLEMQQYGRGRKKDDWLKDLIQVMVFQELYQRRCDHRRCRRKFY